MFVPLMVDPSHVVSVDMSEPTTTTTHERRDSGHYKGDMSQLQLQLAKPSPSPRAYVKSLPPLDVRSYFSRLAVECGAVNLGHGFPNLPVPKFIKEAAAEAIMSPDCHQYAPPKGLASLRQAIAREHSTAMGRPLDPETNVIVTAGANEGILSILQTFVEPGDEVVIFSPAYDNYISHLHILSATPIYIPLRTPSGAPIEDSFDATTLNASDLTIDMDELRSRMTPRTKVIILNTPHNPTGKVWTQKECEAVGEVARECGVVVVCDEVYDRYVYPPATHTPLASLPGCWENTLTVYSAGKTFGITGWRVGWIVGPSSLIKSVLPIHSELIYAANTPLQAALSHILPSLSSESCFFPTLRTRYTTLLATLTSALDTVGLRYIHPQGGMFVLVDGRGIAVPDEFVCARTGGMRVAAFLAKEGGVGVLPLDQLGGSAPRTGPLNPMAPIWLRVAFCKTEETMREAAERLVKLKPYIHY